MSLGQLETLARCTSTAEQCRALGINVGDTIEGFEGSRAGYWNKTRLTLLWIGEEVAVWRVTSRSSERQEWSKPSEAADWTLDCREWRKVDSGKGVARAE